MIDLLKMFCSIRYKLCTVVALMLFVFTSCTSDVSGTNESIIYDNGDSTSYYFQFN